MKRLLPNNISQKGFAPVLGVVLIGVIVIAVVFLLIYNSKNMTGEDTSMGPNDQVNSKIKLGAYYDLTLVGVADPKTYTIGATSGPTIYLPLQGDCQINLTSGIFQVNDNSCLTDPQASFALLANSAGSDNATTYAVYVKTSDSQLSSSKDCKTDAGGTYCPTQSMVVVRGQDSSFTSDVTKLLENVYLDPNATGSPQRFQIFDDNLKDKVWSADADGNKTLTLRLYPQSPQDLEQQDSQN